MIQEYRRQLNSKDILIGFEFEFKKKGRVSNDWNKVQHLIPDFFTQHINQFPFNEIYATPYYDNKKRKIPIAKIDDSLGNAGIELVTPPTNLKTGLDNMQKTFHAINKLGRTDRDCGFHVNLSFTNTNKNKKIRATNIPLYIDEDYIYKHFPHRKKNTYAKPMHKNLASYSQLGPNIECSLDHHMAIDLNKLSGKNKYVEFRYIGGKDYQKQTRQIKTIIGMYIYAMRNASYEKTKNKARPLADELIKKYKRQINRVNIPMW